MTLHRDYTLGGFADRQQPVRGIGAGLGQGDERRSERIDGGRDGGLAIGGGGQAFATARGGSAWPEPRYP